MEIVGLKRKKEKTDDGKVRDEKIEQKAMTGEKKGDNGVGRDRWVWLDRQRKRSVNTRTGKKITREKKEGNQTRQ